MAFKAVKPSMRRPSAKPIVELPYIGLRMCDFSYILHVEMVTSQPGSPSWISELQSVELQTVR